MSAIILFLFRCSGNAQNLDRVNCYNGIKDSTEEGVDCGKGKMYCTPCNGEAEIVLNNKNYKTGIINTTLSEVESQTIFIDKSKAYLYIRCPFYTEGDIRSGVTLNFIFIGKFNKPKKFRITAPQKNAPLEAMGLEVNKEIGLNIQYNKSMGWMSLHKVKNGVFELMSVDPIERKFTAQFTVEAKLADGTPVNLTGSLKNVGF